MSDFVMTYQTFFLLNEHDSPEIQIDGKLCVCLFANMYLVTTFFRDKHGMGREHAQVIAAKSRANFCSSSGSGDRCSIRMGFASSPST